MVALRTGTPGHWLGQSIHPIYTNISIRYAYTYIHTLQYYIYIHYTYLYIHTLYTYIHTYTILYWYTYLYMGSSVCKKSWQARSWLCKCSDISFTSVSSLAHMCPYTYNMRYTSSSTVYSVYINNNKQYNKQYKVCIFTETV